MHTKLIILFTGEKIFTEIDKTKRTENTTLLHRPTGGGFDWTDMHKPCNSKSDLNQYVHPSIDAAIAVLAHLKVKYRNVASPGLTTLQMLHA